MKIKTYQPIMANPNKINQTIASFWNKTSEGWKKIWGPHIHHGFYGTNQQLNPLAAQELLVEKLTELLEIKSQSHILDVGCGMGGSSCYLAERYQAHVSGITLSKKQITIAEQLAKEKNIKDVIFTIENAHTLNSFADTSFDIVWSLESCEQFYDKKLFIQQAFRVLKPGGKLLIATWCSDREEYEGQSALNYRKLCLAFDLPFMPTLHHYCTLLHECGFQLKHCQDWSNEVLPSWDIGLSLVNAYSIIQVLRIGGWRGFRFIKQAKLMRDAFHQKRVKYGVFIAVKP